LGQKGSVTVTYALTEGTIDEEIYDLIERKRSVVNAAVDGVITDDNDGAIKLILDLMGI
jgi:SNF2 family DNA or RNA helicase